MKVKQLEWKKENKDSNIIFIGSWKINYAVDFADDEYDAHLCVDDYYTDKIIDGCRTLEEAQAACQTHYEKWVGDQLEPSKPNTIILECATCTQKWVAMNGCPERNKYCYWCGSKLEMENKSIFSFIANGTRKLDESEKKVFKKLEMEG